MDRKFIKRSKYKMQVLRLGQWFAKGYLKQVKMRINMPLEAMVLWRTCKRDKEYLKGQSVYWQGLLWPCYKYMKNQEENSSASFMAKRWLWAINEEELIIARAWRPNSNWHPTKMSVWSAEFYKKWCSGLQSQKLKKKKDPFRFRGAGGPLSYNK